MSTDEDNDPDEDDGTNKDKESNDSIFSIEFVNVDFAYPIRPGTNVSVEFGIMCQILYLGSSL